jgi:multiple sugar transport system substrate-binding protein
MTEGLLSRRITRRAAVIGGASVPGAVLAACGGAGGTPSGGADARGGKRKAPSTLEVLVSFDPEKEPWFKDTFIPQYKSVVGDQVSVNYTWVDWTKMEDHFGINKVAGTLQDVIRTGAGPWIWIYAEKQIGLPLDDRVRQWGKKDDFFPASYETLVYQGKTYGLVTHTSPRMYPYRKDVADESSAKIADTWTWDDYMNAAVQINRIQDGQLVRLGASPLTLGWQEYMLMFYAGGGKVTKGGKAAFSGPEGEWALDLALQRKTRLQPEGTSGLPSSNVPAFAAGTAGIIYTTPGGFRDVERFAPDRLKDVVVPPPPLKARRVSMVNSDGFAISRDTKHPDEAWEFLKLWFEPAILEKWNEMGYTVPPRKSVAKSAAFMQKPHMQRIVANLEQYGVPVPVWPDYTNLFTNLQQELDAAMKREKSTRVALADSARYWNNVLEQYKWKD